MTVKECIDSGLLKPIIHRRNFTSVDGLVGLINQNRPYDIYPLNRDSFYYHFTQIDCGVIQFIKTQVNSPVHLVGERLRDWREFIVYLNHPARLIWNNYVPLSYQHIFGFANHCDADFIFPSNLIIGSFRIQETYFQQYLKTINYLGIDLDFLSHDYAFLPNTLQPIQAYLRDLFCLTDTTPDKLSHDYLQKLILEDFIPQLIQAIAPKSKIDTPMISPRYRHQLVKEVRDYMMSHLGQPITLKDICQNVYASTRIINYGFQEVFGISPMSYLKILRLYGVRQALQKATSTDSRVQEIARNFGFWSMGHFTRDYKSFFGELPSVTLNQAK